MVYDSISDYTEYLNENANKDQLKLMYDNLIHESQRFTAIKKRETSCSDRFPDFTTHLASHFRDAFVPDYTIPDKNKTSKSIPTKARIVDLTEKYIDQIEIHNQKLGKRVKASSDKKVVILSNFVLPIAIIFALFVLLKILINIHRNKNY